MADTNFSKQNTLPMNYSVTKIDLESEVEEKNDYECTQFDFTNNSIYKKNKVKEEDQLGAEEDEFPPDFENLEEYISEDDEIESADFEEEGDFVQKPALDVRSKRVKKFKEKLQQQIGNKMFSQIYKFISYHRDQGNED